MDTIYHRPDSILSIRTIYSMDTVMFCEHSKCVNDLIMENSQQII